MKIKNITKQPLTIPQGSTYVSLLSGQEMDISIDDYSLINPNLKLYLQIEGQSQTKVEPSEGKTKAVKE